MWVEDPRARAGGYWRRLPNGQAGGELQQTPSTRVSYDLTLKPSDIKKHYNFTVEDYTKEEKAAKYDPGKNKFLVDRPPGYYSKSWTPGDEADAVSDFISAYEFNFKDNVSSKPKELARFIGEWRKHSRSDSLKDLVQRLDAGRKTPGMRQGDRVFVKDPRVQGGGYWRKLPNGGAVTTSTSGGYLKTAALLFGGAIAGGAVGVLATKWADQNKVRKAVADARETANQQADAEVEKIKQELDKVSVTAQTKSAQYEESLKTIAKKEREIATIQAKHQKDKDQLTREHDARVAGLTSKHEKELDGLRAEAGKKEQESTAEVNRLSGELTKLQDSHKQAIAKLQSEHDSVLGKLQSEHDTLQSAHSKLQSENEAQGQEYQKVAKELKAKTKAIADLQKEHDQTVKSLQDKHSAVVADLQQQVGRKEGEAKAAALSAAKQLSDKEEQHQADLAVMTAKHQNEISELQAAFERNKEAAIVEGTKQRKHELEQQHWNRAEQNKAHMESELARRTELAVAEANSKAMEQLARDREQILTEARLKILEVTQPKARQPGQLIDDDKVGIALSASIRQGFVPNKDAKNVARNFNDALNRMIGRKQAEVLQDLGADFKAHAEKIYRDEPVGAAANMSAKQVKTKWQKMETAFISQGNRERDATVKMEAVQKKTLDKYRRAWADLSAKAVGRGGFTEDLVSSFDKQAVKIHNEMLRDIASAIEEVRKENPLDAPFMGGKSRGDSEMKVYAFVGAC